jgi:hypothetical protein
MSLAKSTTPPKFKFTIHAAGPVAPNGTQNCRRCECAVLSEDGLGKWKEGSFVVEQYVWRQSIREGVGYQRIGLFIANEAEVLTNDDYQFCLSVIEAQRHIEHALAGAAR